MPQADPLPTGPEAPPVRRRRFSRNLVNAPTRIEIHADNGGRFTSGTAVIRDISLKGAFLTGIDLEGKFLPCSAFRIHLTMPPIVLPGLQAISRPVRFGRLDDFGLGVEFEDFRGPAASSAL